MLHIKKYLFWLLLPLVVMSCSPASTPSNSGKSCKSYIPKYAQYFRIDYYSHYKKISIFNPWDNMQMNMEYFIATDSLGVSDSISSHGVIVPNAPKRIVCLSSPLVGLMKMLHLRDFIGGVSDPEYIYDSMVNAKIARGEIVNVGKSIQVNMERMIALKPELIFASGWDQMSPDYKKMLQLRLKPVFMYDWQEIHPLGKAEWMIFIAAFYNREQEAQLLFSKIELRYEKLKNSAKDLEKPSVFNGSEYQGIWYSAGGQSYMSRLYQDAGGYYILKDNASQGSVNLDFEVMLNKAINTDIWMYTSGLQKENVQMLYTEKYKHLKAVIKHQVYSYHKRVNELGANDYFETGSWKPDVVLQDLIWIFHPEIREFEKPYYFSRLQY